MQGPHPRRRVPKGGGKAGAVCGHSRRPPRDALLGIPLSSRTRGAGVKASHARRVPLCGCQWGRLSLSGPWGGEASEASLLTEKSLLEN